MHREQREREGRAERGGEGKGQRDFYSPGKIGDTKPSAVKSGVLCATTAAKTLSRSCGMPNNVLFLEGKTQQIMKQSCSQFTLRDAKINVKIASLLSRNGKSV